MTSAIRYIPIEQLCTKVTTGATPLRSRSDYYEAGTIDWYKTGELKDWYLGPAAERITEKALDETSVKLFPANTVLMAMYGDGRTITSLGMLRAAAATNQACSAMLVDEGKCDTRYFFYALKSRRHLLLKVASGGAQRNLSGKLIKEFTLPVSMLPVQRRIAGILSAYDELIENNQRRIQILETMARALYREWFVQFRFPGHEKLPRRASPLGDIPQGWEVREMQEIADVIDCLHSKKPTECIDGPGVFLQLNNIGEAGKLDMGEQFRISGKDYALWTSRIELQVGDCVITNVGRVGAVAQISEGVRAAPGRNMTAIRPRIGRLTPTYLIEYLLSSHMTSEVAKKKDLGTIMDSLNVKGIIRLHVPCPPMEVMQRFERVARPIRKRIEVLVEQIQNLRRTRDLLLPRLLSGELQLAAIDEKAANITSLPVHPTQKMAKKATDEFIEAVVISHLVRKLSDASHPLGRKRYNKFAYWHEDSGGRPGSAGFVSNRLRGAFPAFREIKNQEHRLGSVESRHPCPTGQIDSDQPNPHGLPRQV
jgi:type I restriction enzyme S subunit